MLGKSYYLTSYYPCPWESLQGVVRKFRGHLTFLLLTTPARGGSLLQGGSKKVLGAAYYLTSYYQISHLTPGDLPAGEGVGAGVRLFQEFLTILHATPWHKYNGAEMGLFRESIARFHVGIFVCLP